MVIPDHTGPTGTSDTSAAEQAEQHHGDDRDPLKRPCDSSRLIGDLRHGGGDPAPPASDTQRPWLRSRGESNYAPPAPPDRRPLRIRLPEHDPVIAPPVARALLRLIRNTVGHQQTGPPLTDDHGRTP